MQTKIGLIALLGVIATFAVFIPFAPQTNGHRSLWTQPGFVLWIFLIAAQVPIYLISGEWLRRLWKYIDGHTERPGAGDVVVAASTLALFVVPAVYRWRFFGDVADEVEFLNWRLLIVFLVSAVPVVFAGMCIYRISKGIENVRRHELPTLEIVRNHRFLKRSLNAILLLLAVLLSIAAGSATLLRVSLDAGNFAGSGNVPWTANVAYALYYGMVLATLALPLSKSLSDVAQSWADRLVTASERSDRLIAIDATLANDLLACVGEQNTYLERAKNIVVSFMPLITAVAASLIAR